MLSVREHESPKYPPRTYENARRAQLTVAIAHDFNTAGERLTHRAAGERYLWISLKSNVAEAAEKLADALRQFNVQTLNVAGNGIYGLATKDWTQDKLNTYVFVLLRMATKRWPILKVVSGGQTGTDLAGVTAAHALGIAAEALLPKGYLQRGHDNTDRQHTPKEILEQIRSGAARLTQLASQADRDAAQLKEKFPDPEDRNQILNRVSQREAAQPRAPRLFNIQRDKNIPADVVYIGRGSWRGQKSLCGNPFSIGVDGDRNQVCDAFEEWALTQPEVMAAIESLRGQDLACFCTPYRCHGDWILKIANREQAPVPEIRESQKANVDTAIEFDPQI
jgi:hypothetical protein